VRQYYVICPETGELIERPPPRPHPSRSPTLEAPAIITDSIRPQVIWELPDCPVVESRAQMLKLTEAAGLVPIEPGMRPEPPRTWASPEERLGDRFKQAVIEGVSQGDFNRMRRQVEKKRRTGELVREQNERSARMREAGLDPKTGGVVPAAAARSAGLIP